MSHSINVAWLGEGVSAEHMYALEDAWDHLVVDEEWRDWKRAYLIPAQPFLYLAVRDGLDKRRVQRTKTGGSTAHGLARHHPRHLQQVGTEQRMSGTAGRSANHVRWPSRQCQSLVEDASSTRWITCVVESPPVRGTYLSIPAATAGA